MYVNLNTNELNFIKKLNIKFMVEFNIINSIIELYKYEKAFGRANIKKTEKLIWETLLTMKKKQSPNYGIKITDSELEYAFNIFKKELNTKSIVELYPSYNNYYDNITKYILETNERYKKYNNKSYIKNALKNIGVPNECLKSDAFIINIATLLEEQIRPFLLNVSELSDEFLNNYKNIEEDLTDMFRKYLIITNTEKETKITIRKLNDELITSQYYYENLVNCKYIKKFILEINTLTFDKTNKTLTIFQSENNYADKGYVIHTDNKITVYDKESKMIMDYGNTSIDMRNTQMFTLPNSNNQIYSYRLEVLPNNKCHYIQIKDGETLLETYDLDLIYDTTTIDFKYMKEYTGSEAEVSALKYDNIIAELGLQPHFLTYLKENKIPYLFHESDDISLSTSYDFSIDNMWKIIKKQVEEEKEKILIKKYRGDF